MPAATESRTVMILAFALTLGAGIVGGVLVSSQMARHSKGQVVTPRSALETDLDLTSQQTVQMRKIWEEVRDNVQRYLVRAQSLEHERQARLEEILTDEQKSRYQKLSEEYNNKLLDLRNERELVFKKGIEQTKQVLSQQQSEKYDKILREKTGREPGQSLLDIPASLPATVGLEVPGNGLPKP